MLQGQWACTWFPVSHHCYDPISTQGKHAPGEAGSLIQKVHSRCVTHDCTALGTAYVSYYCIGGGSAKTLASSHRGHKQFRLRGLETNSKGATAIAAASHRHGSGEPSNTGWADECPRKDSDIVKAHQHSLTHHATLHAGHGTVLHNKTAHTQAHTETHRRAHVPAIHRPSGEATARLHGMGSGPTAAVSSWNHGVCASSCCSCSNTRAPSACCEASRKLTCSNSVKHWQGRRVSVQCNRCSQGNDMHERVPCYAFAGEALG